MTAIEQKVRVERVYRMLRAGGYDEENALYLLVDFHHWCDAKGIDYKTFVGLADGYYEEEK